MTSPTSPPPTTDPLTVDLAGVPLERDGDDGTVYVALDGLALTCDPTHDYPIVLVDAPWPAGSTADEVVLTFAAAEAVDLAHALLVLVREVDRARRGVPRPPDRRPAPPRRGRAGA